MKKSKGQAPVISYGGGGLFINANGDMNQMCVLSYRQRERPCVCLREKEGEREVILEKNLYLCIKNGLSFLNCYTRKRMSLKNRILVCVRVLITCFNE